MKEIIFSTATELVRAIRKKQVSAVEVLEAHLAQLAKYNSAENRADGLPVGVQIVGRRWSEERPLTTARQSQR